MHDSFQGRRYLQDKVLNALLQYRNTPNRRDGLSPAQKLYGHPIQDVLPAHRKSFDPKHQKAFKDAEEKARITDEKQAEYYNKTAHELSELKIGQHVAVYNEKTKQWDIYARVVERMRTRRYKVKTVYGTILSRNRKHLRPRTAYSIPVSGRGEDTRGATEQDNSEPLTNKPEARAPQSQTQDTRRSSRARKKPTRLIEDHSWH